MFYHAKISQKNKNKKKNVDHILRCNVAKSWAKFGSNYQFFPKGDILVKLNVTFTYLLHPIMLGNISQISIEWMMKYEVAEISGNLIKLSICPIRSFFWEKWLLLFVDHLYSIMLLTLKERSQKVN